VIPQLFKRGSTQEIVGIDEVTHGMVRFLDGSYAVILKVSTVNTALQDDDQNVGTMREFRRFLDSIQWPVQIWVRKVRHSMDDFVAYLEDCALKESEDPERGANPGVLKMISLYQEFVQGLNATEEFFEDEFYVILADESYAMGKGSLLQSVPVVGPMLGGRKRGRAQGAQAELRDVRKRLSERAQSVARGLGGIPLEVQELDNEHIIELFYSLYAPDAYQLDVIRNAVRQHVSTVLRVTPGDRGGEDRA
jgi:hypothetical protein